MKRKFLAPVFAAFLFVLSYSSCSKIDTTDLGGELIPAIDNVETFDTILDVISNNILIPDTTTMLYTELHTAGIIENDAAFGKTQTYFYSSFVPSQIRVYPFVKRDSVTIDSVVLSLAFNDVYGDTNALQTFEVREIKPDFAFSDSGYRINREDIPTWPGLVGSGSVYFASYNDSVFYRNDRDTIRSRGEARIHLDTLWARRFVNYDTTAGNAYNTDSLFKTKFRGFEIKPSEASADKRALAYFNLADNARTRITFYCRIQNNGKTDTIAPHFIYSSGDPEANIVRRTPANEYLTNLNNGLENDELVYLQSTPGSYISIKVPELSNLDNRVIHRAELIMEQAPTPDENFYRPPNLLFIEALSQSGDSVLTVRKDFVPINSSPGYDVNLLGGQYKNSKYVFNITRHVQGIVTERYNNYTLRVTAPFGVTPYYLSNADVPTQLRIPIVINGKIAGGRVAVYGGAYPDINKRMRLRLTYSKIKP